MFSIKNDGTEQIELSKGASLTRTRTTQNEELNTQNYTSDELHIITTLQELLDRAVQRRLKNGVFAAESIDGEILMGWAGSARRDVPRAHYMAARLTDHFLHLKS